MFVCIVFLTELKCLHAGVVASKGMPGQPLALCPARRVLPRGGVEGWVPQCPSTLLKRCQVGYQEPWWHPL